jgi:hypothetical protein
MLAIGIHCFIFHAIHVIHAIHATHAISIRRLVFCRTMSAIFVSHRFVSS